MTYPTTIVRHPGYRAWVVAHPTTAFFVGAYGISWLVWLPAVVGVGGPVGALSLFAGVFGPAVSAAWVTHLTGGSVREWIRGLRGHARLPW